MNFFKYSVLTLFVAIITDVIIASAYNTPMMVNVSPTLNGMSTYETAFFNKNTLSNQSYENHSSITSLTNPCPSCRIEVQAINKNGDRTESIITVMGTKKYFSNLSAVYGDYKLTVKRKDVTLIKTYHSGLWNINII